MEILSLLLALGLWLIIRTLAKRSARKCSEPIEESSEDGGTEREPVKSFEKIFLKYTAITTICIEIVTILISISLWTSDGSVDFLFYDFRYIYLFKNIYLISTGGLGYILSFTIMIYAVIFSIDLGIMIAKGKHFKKIKKIIILILTTIILLSANFFLCFMCGFSENDFSQYKVCELDGYSLVIGQMTGFLYSGDIYVFEVRSMTDITVKKIINDCEYYDITNVECKSDKVIISYGKDHFLQGYEEKSAVVYFSE